MTGRFSQIGLYRWRALIALVMIAGFLGFLIWKNEAARANGAEIILETQPIDPRDVFFGHYATLSYNIERRPNGYFELMEPSLQQEAIEAWESRKSDSRWRRSETRVYVLFDKSEIYDRPLSIVSDFGQAQRSGNPFLQSQWRATGNFQCRKQDIADERCWYISLLPDLPRRYYADPETALALQARVGEARRVQRELQVFEKCERARTEATPETLESESCENITAPPEPAPDFGIILTVSDDGEAVIKGVYFDGRKIYDTLTGPRITKRDIQ